jgi:hypothetical protein
MADAKAAGQLCEGLVREYLGNKPEALDGPYVLPVTRHDAGSLLTSVLERKKPRVDHLRRVLDTKGAEKAAAFARLVRIPMLATLFHVEAPPSWVLNKGHTNAVRKAYS